MPTYSYGCPKCGRIEEVFHSIKANPRIKCKKCGSACKRKLGSGAGIIFKGSGFYETDYKRSGSKGGGTTKSDGASGESSGGESKAADSGGEKPAAKAASETKGSGGAKADSGTKSASKSAKKDGGGR